MFSSTPSLRVVLAVFLAASLGSLATAQSIFLLTPPPDSQTSIPSAEVTGIVVESSMERQGDKSFANLPVCKPIFSIWVEPGTTPSSEWSLF